VHVEAGGQESCRTFEKDCGCPIRAGIGTSQLRIMPNTRPLPPALQAFIESSKWTFAKTIPEWPHEYIVRGRVDEVLFVELVRHIRANGYEGKFYRRSITYFNEGDMVYWTMGAPIEETTIINCCRKEDTYEVRLLKGTLPESKGGKAE
jgi:hypothetical protein